jgi:hypothetical protein
MTLVQLPDSGPMPIRLRASLASLVNSRIQPAMDGWGFDPFFIVGFFPLLFFSFSCWRFWSYGACDILLLYIGSNSDQTRHENGGIAVCTTTTMYGVD